MASRACPWRQKPPDGFEERISAVSAVRMFLLQETGPTSFVIKEAEPPEGAEAAGVPSRAPSLEVGEAAVAALAAAAGYPATAAAAAEAAAARAGAGPRRRRAGDDKFKVQIGSSMRCSCRAKGEGPCKHLLFVLLKILRVPPENPFLWQDSLLDHEIDQVLRGRYQVDAGSKRRQARKADADAEGVAMKPIEAGDVCAICQEDLCDESGEVLTDNGPMVFCKQSCGNSVHAKCMKVWAEHKSSVGDKITCPFCREDWGPGAVETIKKEIRQSRRPPNVHYGVTCSACKAGPITGNRFRCLVCADLDLCERCFSTNRAHIKDGHPFVSRPTVDVNWVAATRTQAAARAAGRGRGAVGELAVPAELVEELQSRELGVEDYDLLLQLDAAQGPTPLHQHLAAALARPSESEVAAACARGDGLCGICSTQIRMGGVMHELRKAPCGTVLHLACIQSHIAGDSNLLCPCCSDPLFNGLRPPGRAPVRAPSNSSQARANATAAAPHSRRGTQAGGAPQIHSARDRSPAQRLLAGGALGEAASNPGFHMGMAVTGRHVSREHAGGDSSEARRDCPQLMESRNRAGPGRSRGRASAGGPAASAGGLAVGAAPADGLGLTSGERIRAEPAAVMNARLQRARRDARATSLDPAERSSGPLVDGIAGVPSLQVSARHLPTSAANLPPVLARSGQSADNGNDDGDSGQDFATPGGLAARDIDVHAPTPAAAAAAAAEARLAAAARDASAYANVPAASPRGGGGGSSAAGISRDLPLQSGGRPARVTGSAQQRAASGRPPRAETVPLAGGLGRGSLSHRPRASRTVGDRQENSRSLSVGGDGIGGEGGEAAARGRSTSTAGRTAGGHGASGRAANVRRGRSTVPAAGAPVPADAALRGAGMQGISMTASGVSRAEDSGHMGGGLLPELVSPGIQRPGSEPTVAGCRGGEQLRVRDRDHLDLARDRRQERDKHREREEERTRAREQMNTMVLGGSGLRAGLPGKVGRHAHVGRKHLGGGQLRPLNQRAEADGPVLMYETTLS